MSKKTKIKEAEHFLAQMKAEQDNREQFEFNLSAFLSAARSVLQYAYKEVKKAGINEMKWYENSMSGSPFVGYFRDKRDTNVHVEPVKPIGEYLLEITEHVGVSDSYEDEVRDKNGKIIAQGTSDKSRSEPEKQETSVVEEVKYKFRNWSGNEDVITLCERYIQELKKLVQDGVNKGFIIE